MQLRKTRNTKINNLKSQSPNIPELIHENENDDEDMSDHHDDAN